VTKAKTTVEGCFITRLPAAKPANVGVTFSKDVARILQNRCQECHRAGQIGPMPLLTYDDASSWSQMIREVVSEQRMPPWHADPQHGKFANDWRLSNAQKQQIYDWVDAGAPEGDKAQLPPPRQFTTGWQIGEPDDVFYIANKPYN